MPGVLWRGRLSLPMKLMVDANCVLGWLLGTTRDRAAMKRRVQVGYDGGCTDAVARYDETGLGHFTRTSEALLAGVEVAGRTVLDIGCGTGIASLLAVARGAARVVGGDLAEGMLAVARSKAQARGLAAERIDFQSLDAEALPFGDGSFDVVVSSVMLEFAPDPARVLAEMARVLAPGGRLAISTHGPGYYWEAIDATFRAVPKRPLLGYRPEVWQRTVPEVHRLVAAAGFADVACRQELWVEAFPSGGAAFDFFLATSAGWWAGVLPAAVRQQELARLRAVFERRGVDRITTDIVIALARKPSRPGATKATAAAGYPLLPNG